MKSFFVGLISLVFVFATSVYAKPGVVTLYNNGTFSANLTVQYLLNDMNVTEASDPVSNGGNGSLLVPDGALDCYVKVQALLNNGSYKTIYERNFPGEFSQYTWNNTGHLCLNATGTVNYPICYEDQCPPYGKEVDLAVANKGRYIANFSLQYFLNNVSTTQHSKSIPSGKAQHIIVPAGALNATLVIQAHLLTGQSGQYKTVCEKFFHSLADFSDNSGRVCMTTLGSMEHAVCYADKC